nr:hypothetical protein CFP56_03684 [Quercus suber]
MCRANVMHEVLEDNGPDHLYDDNGGDGRSGQGCYTSINAGGVEASVPMDSGANTGADCVAGTTYERARGKQDRGCNARANWSTRLAGCLYQSDSSSSVDEGDLHKTVFEQLHLPILNRALHGDSVTLLSNNRRLQQLLKISVGSWLDAPQEQKDSSARNYFDAANCLHCADEYRGTGKTEQRPTLPLILHKKPKESSRSQAHVVDSAVRDPGRIGTETRRMVMVDDTLDKSTMHAYTLDDGLDNVPVVHIKISLWVAKTRSTTIIGVKNSASL